MSRQMLTSARLLLENAFVLCTTLLGGDGCGAKVVCFEIGVESFLGSVWMSLDLSLSEYLLPDGRRGAQVASRKTVLLGFLTLGKLWHCTLVLI